jgi:hypothetical protein
MEKASNFCFGSASASDENKRAYNKEKDIKCQSQEQTNRHCQTKPRLWLETQHMPMVGKEPNLALGRNDPSKNCG